MVNYFQTAAIVAALTYIGGGVAAAEPVSVANVTRTVDTREGYNLSASLTNMTINSVPNMAATAFTREAYMSGTASAIIDGSKVPVIDGKRSPITGGKLELWLMVGCQIDMSAGGYIGGSASLSAGNILNNLLAAVPPFIIDDSEGLTPSASDTMKPGTITYQKLKDKSIPLEIANQEISRSGQFVLNITVSDAHIKADSCGGPVSLRLGATAQMSTNKNDDESNAYGDILNI